MTEEPHVTHRIDQLTALASLRERGLVTADEFEREKARVLAAPDAPAPSHAAPADGPPRDAPMPESNMIWAILTTIFCFLPFGVVAIVKSSQVAPLWYAGHRDEAKRAADSSGAWSIASVGLGVLLAIIVIMLHKP